MTVLNNNALTIGTAIYDNIIIICVLPKGTETEYIEQLGYRKILMLCTMHTCMHTWGKFTDQKFLILLLKFKYARLIQCRAYTVSHVMHIHTIQSWQSVQP